MNADTLALAVMDDDGWGCAITTAALGPTDLAAYLEVKAAYEAMVGKWGRATTPGDPVPPAIKRVEARIDAMKDAAGDGGPGDPVCCQRYSFLHHPTFSVSGCRWFGHPSRKGAS